MRRGDLSPFFPSSVSRAPRPCFTNRAQPSCSSSRRTCIDTADWVLCTRSAALVNEPESTMARKERSWSVSSMGLILYFDRLLYKHSLDRSLGSLYNSVLSPQAVGRL